MEWKTSGEGRREGDATGRKWGEGKEEERRFASTTKEGEITAINPRGRCWRFNSASALAPRHFRFSNFEEDQGEGG